MAFFRIVFTGVLCALLSVPVLADKGDEYRQGGQAVSHGLTGTGNKTGGGTNTVNNCSKVEHIGNNCTSNTGSGKCNCQRYEGKGSARKCVAVGCSVKKCNKGLNFYYNQFEDGKSCLYGASPRQANVEDEEYPLYKGIGVTICGSKGFCGRRPNCPDGQVAPKLKLSDGTVVFAGCYDVSTFTRVCPSGEIFENENSTKCVPCTACMPKNAKCELKGSNGVDQCYYETSCADGYEKEQNHDKYNPICTEIPKPVVAPEPEPCNPAVLNAVAATRDANGNCVATKCLDNKSIIVDGKCEECPPCTTSTAECEVYVDNNVCKYKTTCPGDKIIENDGHPDASCVERQPDEYSITYDLDGGSGCENEPRKYKVGTDTIINCIPTKEGFEIAGWVMIVNGSETHINGMPYTIKDVKGDISFKVSGWKEIDKPRTECTDAEKAKFPHADEFKFEDGKCIPVHCEEGYDLDKDKNECKEKDKPRTECTDAEKAKFPHADKFEFKDGQCKPTHCEKGYKLKDGECVDDGIKEAEDKYKKAKDTENSFENRMLGGTTMAATGIGGMQLAQGLAEQNADDAAERDMRAYLATFQCKVGDQTYFGGTQKIEVAGANQLINLYQEYAKLAGDLKERKSALGMKAGIESEVVIDKATSGLYNDVGTGIGSGAYASIARALQNPNGEDAKRWAEQKESSGTRVKAGAIAAGAGTLVGIAGNILINGDQDEEQQENQENQEKQETMVVADPDNMEKSVERELEFNKASSSGSWGCSDFKNVIRSSSMCGNTFKSNPTEKARCEKCTNVAGTYENGRCYIEIVGWHCDGHGWNAQKNKNPATCSDANKYSGCRIVRKYADAEKPFTCDMSDVVKNSVLSGCAQHGWSSGDKHPPFNLDGNSYEKMNCSLPLANNTGWRVTYTSGSAIGLTYKGVTKTTTDWCMPTTDSIPWNNSNHTGGAKHLKASKVVKGGSSIDYWYQF